MAGAARACASLPSPHRRRGVLVGGHTLMEPEFARDPLIRRACAAEGLAIDFASASTLEPMTVLNIKPWINSTPENVCRLAATFPSKAPAVPSKVGVMKSKAVNAVHELTSPGSGLVMALLLTR